MMELTFDEIAILLGIAVAASSVTVVVGAIVLHERQRRSDLSRLLAGFGLLLIEWGEQARHRPRS